MAPVAAAAAAAVSSPAILSASAFAAAAVAAAAAAASPALVFPNPNLCLARSSRLLSSHRHPSLLRFQPLPPPKPLRIVRRSGLTVSAVSVPSFLPSHPPAAVSHVLAFPKLLLASVQSLPGRITAAAARAAPTPEQLAAIRAIFFAALASRPPGGSFRTPLRAVASGAASWLGLYAEILSLRCLLSWFPNIPWERQPFSALRDLSDPYLILFRTIFPPIGGFDMSPILAFWVLGIIASILKSNPGMVP